MSQSFDAAIRRDSLTVPKIWVAVALSLLIHGLALWQWPPNLLRPAPDDLPQERNARGPMRVEIVPERRMRPPAPRAQPAPREQPAVPRTPPQKQAARPAPQPRAQSKPPVLALPRRDAAPAPSPPSPSPSRVPIPARPAAPAREPTAADLMAYVEGQRRARIDLTGRSEPAETAPAAPPREDETARANRIAAANLGLGNDKPAMGADPRRGGGIFEVRHLGFDYAEFAFFGWNKEMRRNTAQIIEVRKGSYSDIRVAVVRRMIDIIRDHEQFDFTWESHRLRRIVTMSARQRDTGALEAFLMREFFDEGRPPSRR